MTDLSYSKEKQLRKLTPKQGNKLFPVASRSKLIKELDRVFSLFIRYRDHWQCKKCGKQHEEGTGELQNSHFWSRDDKGTRWDPKNCDAACAKVFQLHQVIHTLPGGQVIRSGGRSMLVSCHGQWEGEKQGAYRDFKLNQLGHAEYSYMEMRARTSTKFSAVDLQLLLDYWNKELERVKAEYHETH